MHSRFSKQLVLVLLLLAVCVSLVAGQTARSSSSSLTITEPVADDLLTAARELHVQAEVKSYLAATGERITIDGPIDGYMMSAGRTVTLDGRVGNINGNRVVRASEPPTISPGAQILGVTRYEPMHRVAGSHGPGSG